MEYGLTINKQDDAKKRLAELRRKSQGQMSGPREERGGSYPEETSLDIARRLLQHEVSTHHSDLELAEATELLCRTMRPYLVDIMGTIGFRSMMSHALSMTSRAAERPGFHLTSASLSLVKVDDDGCLKWLEKSELDSPHQNVVVAILAHFFDLLTNFIGQNLVLRLVHQVWPDFVVLPPFSPSKEII